MDAPFLILLTFAGLAIVVSFLCSMWEAALLSITPAYALAQQEKGGAIGRRLAGFKENIDRPLAAILTLNTIAHTVGAIGVGNQASLIWQESNPLITGVAVPVIMTLAILVLSEIIPKTLGANYWKELAPFTVFSLAFLMKVLAPLVWMTELITRALRRDASGPIFSRRELTAMAEAGAREGVIEKHESHLIRSLMNYRAVQARDVMTPRTVTVMASATMTFADFQQQLADVRFSRIPLFNPEDAGQIPGYILRSEALESIAAGMAGETLESIRREILVVMETDTIDHLFTVFLERREHMAVVVDNFGEMRGVVTLEDVIETMLGLEIVDELDDAEDMQVLAREAWKRRARARGISTDV